MSVSVNLQMVVDRIRFFAIVEKSLGSMIWSQFKEMAAMTKEILPNGKIKVRQSKYGQTRLWYQPERKRTIAVLEVGTTAMKQSYFKLDLLPARFGKGEFEHFKSVLTAVLEPVNYAKLYATAKVSYLELAIDFLHAPMGSFIPYFAKSWSSFVYHLQDGTGGIYLGAETANIRFCIYDKARWLWEVLKQASIHKTRTRIEARIHTTGLLAGELGQALPNPFPRLEVADRKELMSISQHPSLAWFLESCSAVGASRALNLLGAKERRQILASLRKARAWWWKPMAYWKDLPNALKVIAP